MYNFYYIYSFILHLLIGNELTQIFCKAPLANDTCKEKSLREWKPPYYKN